MPESITINKHNEYEIKEIFDKKNTKNELWYKVKWLEWLQKYNQWIIYKNLENASELWNAYDKQYKHFKGIRSKKRWRYSFLKLFSKGFLRFLLRFHKEERLK